MAIQGDSKHQFNHANGWPDPKDIDVHPWWPNSPHGSIIEHLWDPPKCMVRDSDPLPKNQEELWLALKETWENIDHEFIDRLYDSLSSRVGKLLKGKGGATQF
jgi:hypothetical protein